MKMKKLLLGIAICTFLFGSGFLYVDKAAGETINLKFAHFMSPKHIQHRMSFAPFCEKVAEITEGKVKIKIYPARQLAGPRQLADAIKTGITDIGFVIPSYTTGRFPRTSALDLPFLFETGVDAARAFYDLFDAYMADDYKAYKVLWLYATGPGQLMSAIDPIKNVGDLSGLKLRTPSAYMTKALKLLDVNPVGMPIPKLAMSLQKRVIDGCITPFSAVTDFRLFELVKHITVANMYITPMTVLMNKQKYEGLPDYAKKAIDLASGKPWGLHAADVYDQHDTNTVLEINKRGKITIYPLPPAEKDKMARKLAVMQSNWIDEWSKRGIPADRIMSAVNRASDRYQ
jgi:TRAP-type C4-dicarboxylate transport system substrate-binding protein